MLEMGLPVDVQKTDRLLRERVSAIVFIEPATWKADKNEMQATQ